VGRVEFAGEAGDEDPAHVARFEAVVVDLFGEDPPVAGVAHRIKQPRTFGTSRYVTFACTARHSGSGGAWAGRGESIS
jgi:hypothetical protein